VRLPVHQWARAWHDAPADLFTRLHAAAEEAGQGRTVLTFTLPAKPLHRLAPAPEQVLMKEGGGGGKGVGEVGAAL